MNDIGRCLIILALGLCLGSTAGYAALHGPAAAISRIGTAIPSL